MAHQRYPDLDALRGVAALFVLLFHYTTRYQQLYGHTGPLLLEIPFGHFGVQLFFVISGWVVLSAASRAASVTQFLAHRAIRLYPAYLLAVAVTATCVTLADLPGRKVNATQVAINFSMVQSALRVPHVDGVYWSLTVELMFYFVLSVAIATRLLSAASIRRTVVAWVGLLLLLTVAPPVKLLAATVGVLGYGRCFAAGAVIGVAKDDPRVRYALLAIGALLVGEYAQTGAAAATVLAIGTGVCLVIARRPRPVFPGWVGFLGTASYPLYLLHQNIGYVAIRTLEAAGVNATCAVLTTGAAIIAISWGIARGFEEPLRAFLRAWMSRQYPGGRPGSVMPDRRVPRLSTQTS